MAGEVRVSACDKRSNAASLQFLRTPISSFLPPLFSSFHLSMSVVVRVKVVLDGWACAHKVTIAVSLVDTAHCRPNLASKLNPTCGVAGLLTRVAMLPLICHQVAESVR